MSVVAYFSRGETLYADSICVDGYHRMLAQKAFRYVAEIQEGAKTDAPHKESGSAGFVGDPAIGFALITAYGEGGLLAFEERRKELLETLPDKEDRQSGDILIVPDEGSCMWLTSGLSRPLFPVPKQDLVLGTAQMTSRVWQAFDDTGDMEQAIYTAITSSERRDDSALACHPVIRVSRAEYTGLIRPTDIIY